MILSEKSATPTFREGEAFFGIRLKGSIDDGSTRPGGWIGLQTAPGALGQASRPHDPVRDDGGSADLCSLDRHLPAQLAQRPPVRRLYGRAGAGGSARG